LLKGLNEGYQYSSSSVLGTHNFQEASYGSVWLRVLIPTKVYMNPTKTPSEFLEQEIAVESEGNEIQGQEALLIAGALQNAILSSANFSSIATDAKGVIQIFNVGAERMLGYSAADVVNKITPADISDPQEVIARAKVLTDELKTPIAPGFEALVFKASRGIEDIYELTYIRKDGSHFPAVVSVTALRDNQDAIIGYLLIGTDNTARKNAEEALIKAGALQAAIFNSANFSSIATDAKGVIQIFNVGAERMLGYAASEVMDRITPADLSDPDELIVRAKALSVELETAIAPGFEALVFKASRGIEDIYELTYIRKNGTHVPAVVSVTALRDDQNLIIGYLLIGTDNTARKQIEAEQKLLGQRLRDHQFYTRSLFEANIDALMTTDPAGIITDVNKQMESLTSCTRDELIGAPFKNYFTDPKRAEDAIMLVLTKKKVTNYELTARDRNGKETVVSYNATTFYDRDRKLQGVFAAARGDITERKQAMELLQQARSEADRANAAKSRFLAAASHDLRQPLSSLSLYASLLSISNPPTARTVANIRECIGSLSALLTDLLDISKLEARVVTPNIRSFPIAAMLTSLDSILSPKAKAKGLELRYRPSNWTAHCDPVLFRRILGNLIENAIQYTEHGGVLVACRHRQGKNWVEVWDTGIGIEADQSTEIFEEFKQLGDQARNKGSGLGLAIVAKTTDLLGLEVQVRSRPGRGSVFAVELPLGLEAQVEQAPAASGLLFRALRIAVVEDNPIVRMALEDCLLQLGHQVVAADGKATLLAELGTLSPDIVVSDYRLAQGETGFDVITAVQARFGSTLPAILITGDTDPTLMRSLSERGIVVLHKPLELETLRATIEDLTN
jgi:PAS domain S-box-containing protein